MKKSDLTDEPEENRVKLKNIGTRLKNVFKYHYRGLVGFFVPLIVLPVIGTQCNGSGITGGTANSTANEIPPPNSDIWALCVYLWMFWSMIWQPTNTLVTGIIPIFMLPMIAILPSHITSALYLNDMIMLVFLSNILLLMSSNCGLDRRISLKILSMGSSKDNDRWCSAKMILFKSTLAAFLLPMLSHRLIATNMVMEYMNPELREITKEVAENAEEEERSADYKKYRFTVMNAIHTSASIGSLALIHSTVTSLTMRTMFIMRDAPKNPAPDLFSYSHYACFALPAAVLMYIVNLIYHMSLIPVYVKGKIKPSAMSTVTNNIIAKSEELPRVSLHVWLCTLSYFLYLTAVFAREGPWTDYSAASTDTKLVNDATYAAIFILALSIIPSTIRFLKECKAKYVRDLEYVKTESGVIWWDYVDTNTNYALLLLIGGGLAIYHALLITKFSLGPLDEGIKQLSIEVGILIFILVTLFFANIMTGMAACVMLLPVVLLMCQSEVGSGANWNEQCHLPVLAVGMSSSLGFMYPFIYTPAYFCRSIARMPRLKMAALNIIPTLLSGIILWIMITFYAPVIWPTARR